MTSNKGENLIKRVLLGAVFALILSLAMPGAARGAPRPRPDFNGDSRADLAIGVPNQNVGDAVGTGVVHVIYGTPGGPNPFFGNQIFSALNCTLIDGITGNQTGLHFGSVLAWGDFNGDGYDDLAVGIPDYNPPYPPDGMPQAGMVYILKGSAAGLVLAQTQALVSTNLGPPLNVNQDRGDRFSAALAAGNFNGDISPAGYPIDDLAIGTPGEDGWDGVASIPNAGDVYVVYGKSFHLGDPRPLDRTTAQGWSQNGKAIWWPDIEGHPQAGDQFGSALVAGDFNGDGCADLAIGVPGEAGGVGAVNVIYGSPVGLHAAAGPGDQFWQQGLNIPGMPVAGELFGFSLAAGNFNGNVSPLGYPIDDLAIGAPRAAVANQAFAGEVNVIYGSNDGLQAGGQHWTQSSPGILDDGNFAGDQFGFALAAADFNGDGRADLAIGVPFDDPGVVASAGAVNVIYGSAAGLNAFAPVASQYWHQNSPGIQGINDLNDQLGRSLAAGDFNGDGLADLVVGVPNDRVGGISAGAVNLIYGSPSPVGLGSAAGPGNQLWHQNSPGVPDVCEPGDSFGVGARR